MKGRWLLGALIAIDVTALVLISQRVHAQVLDPHAGEQAYLTADPIDPDRLGLATPDGRYAVRPVQSCDGFGVGQNVLIFPNMNLPPWLAAAPVDWDGSGDPPCLLRLEGRMDATPCFMNDAQMCDAAAESDE